MKKLICKVFGHKIRVEVTERKPLGPEDGPLGPRCWYRICVHCKECLAMGMIREEES